MADMMLPALEFTGALCSKDNDGNIKRGFVWSMVARPFGRITSAFLKNVQMVQFVISFSGMFTLILTVIGPFADSEALGPA